MGISDALQLSDAALFGWLTSQQIRTNLLVVSRHLPLDRVADCLMRRLPSPAVLSELPGRLRMPVLATGTWFLQDVARMSPAQQYELDRWLVNRQSEIQLVSISSAPLWPLVATGGFLESLYYGLNSIVFEAESDDLRSNYDERVDAR
jgi:hypothetical protein